MHKRKIIAVIFAVAIVVAATVSYEYFMVNSVSGYTKVSLTSDQTYSVKFCGDSTAYNITFFYNYNQNGTVSTRPVFQVTAQTLVNNTSQFFEARQGLRCSYSGLQMVLGNVNSNQMVLYVKSVLSNSKPIISPLFASSG